ncbi:class I SAM-dependent RNA methyltransferase [Demequina lignilytica]|uniref:TRAM domain-containing protein n=1 Tax=Demequina lignilytica TaxID=3051663 RepID=A0AB35MEF4_9MICO|nr:TRAM domain-containing protein [Demequina sp. SYSU T0a273]MDN4482118.1 TRAM domain-containing protein [Demequina sp. SYSU T0a273]
MAELVRLDVGKVAHGGHCVARHEGRVVFVRHALPGEVVMARVTEGGDDARMWRADAVEVLEASPDRVPSVWPEAGPGGIGGGELAHVALPAQRRWKLAVLRESFERFARVEFPGEVAPAPGDDARGGLRWRTRATATAGPDGRASMHLHRGDGMRPLGALPIAVEAVERALLDGRFPAGSRVAAVAPGGGEARLLVDGRPWRGGRADTRPNAPRRVRESVETPQGRWDYQVDAAGFWQVHVEAPHVLVEQVLSRVGEADVVLDLYAGAGLFTVPLASQGRSVTSVEADAGASRDARRNAHALPSAGIVHEDTRRFLETQRPTADAVVLDPPRSGAGARTLAAVDATAARRLVYVACDPVALARDVALLAGHGFRLVEAQAFDLFPMTHHVETVATFERS